MTPCSVSDCPRPHKAKGYCISHYRNWRRNGKPEPLTVEERFWLRVDRSGGPDTCWPWRGTMHRENGYGVIRLSSGRSGVMGPLVGAHRFSWRLANGRWPRDNRYICHTCDNPQCCNPGHLYEGTPAQNCRDTAERGRSRNGVTVIKYGPAPRKWNAA